MTDRNPSRRPDQFYGHTQEIVDLTQPPEVRELLTTELEQLKRRSTSIRNSEYMGGMGIALGGSVGSIIATIAYHVAIIYTGDETMRSSQPIASGAGFGFGTAAGAAVDFILVSVSQNKTREIIRELQADFADRVWDALPPETQAQYRNRFASKS